MSDNLPAAPGGEFILYQTEDGRTRVEVRFEDETVWLSQKLMAELFQKDVRTISEHIRNIFAEGELQKESVIRDYRITAPDGKTYQVEFYNLDVIYATSVDYTPDTAMSQQFFATVQNKMHWAVHGQTAAEVIHARADASQPFMGFKTTRPGGIVRREDVAIAKNYLNEEELHALNRIVNAYIEFAELQALSRRVMTMRDWIEKLDDFLRLSDRELLDHVGKISAETARSKAELEFDRYHALTDAQPRPVDADFERAVKQIERAKVPVPSRTKGGKA
jgi:hypothetical protein